MGRGFGRGAKSVAIVTHAQVKNAKKAPRGLKITRKKRRQAYRDLEADADPNRMLDTGDDKDRSGGKKKKNLAPKTLEQQIAGIDFPIMVSRGKGKLRNLRKDIVHQVKNLRRRHHQKQESKAKEEVKRVEHQMMKQRRAAEEQLAAQKKSRAEAEAKKAVIGKFKKSSTKKSDDATAASGKKKSAGGKKKGGGKKSADKK